MTRNAALLEAVADIERTMKEARDRSPFRDVPLKRSGGLVPGNRYRTQPHGPGRGAAVVTGADPLDATSLPRTSESYAVLSARRRAFNASRERKSMQPKQAAE